MSFLLLLLLLLLLATLGAIDFAARKLFSAAFEAWAALFLLFALATGLTGCAQVGHHGLRLPGFLVLSLFIILATIVVVAGTAGGDDDGQDL